MRFATRIWFSFSVLLLGYFLTVAISWWLSLSAERTLTRVGTADFTGSLLSQRANAAFIHQTQAYQDAVLQGESHFFLTASSEADEVAHLLADMSGLALAPVHQREIQDLMTQHALFTKEASKAYPLISADASNPTFHDQATRLYAQTGSLKAGFNTLNETLSDELRRELTTTITTAREHRYQMLSAFAVISAISLALAIYVVRQLTTRLQALVLASDRLASGNYQSEVIDRYRDEIGILATSFNTMRQTVRARDSDLRTLNESLEGSVRARTLELSQRNQELTREVADRQKAEQSLRLLESAVTQTDDSVVIAAVDPARPVPQVVYVNPAFTRILGYASTDIQGGSLEVLAGAPKVQTAIHNLVQGAVDGQAGFQELENTAKDGSVRMIEWRMGPIRQLDGSITHIVATLHDISDRKRAEAELERVHVRLLDASRQAGQAEVATGVLHNVGNVLNSINVSSAIMVERLRSSRIEGLAKTIAMLRAQGAALPEFLIQGGRLPQVIDYLDLLSKSLGEERTEIQAELLSLVNNIDHVKYVVGMQQSYARHTSFTSATNPSELMDDAVRMHATALSNENILVERSYQDLPAVLIDKHRTLQILVNLVSNAHQALKASRTSDRRLWASVQQLTPSRIQFSIRDNGMGIEPEHLSRIFSHGFTTRSDGHGFGLHSSALAAKEMGGTLRVTSPGRDQGATFLLEMPI